MKNGRKNFRDTLKDLDVTMVKFYFHNTDVMDNCFISCILIRDAGDKSIPVARGVSIRSMRDQFNKSKGKAIALGRAIKALKNDENSEKIETGIGVILSVPKESIRYNRFHEKELHRNINVRRKLIQEKIERIEKDPSIINFKSTIKDGKLIAASYSIPLNYPLIEARKYYEFKSQVRPVLYEFELSLYHDGR